MEVELYIDQLEPSPWNPNVMSEERFQALIADMKDRGKTGIDRILVSPKNVYYGDESLPKDRYMIVDGHHRVNAAQLLEWRTILCNVEELSETDSKSINYRKNRERGDIDAFREAALFQAEADAGMTQQKIADKYGVKRDYVSRRLRFTQVPEAVKELYEKSRDGSKDVPRGTLTPSHLEELVVIDDPKEVAELAKDIVDERHSVSVTRSFAQSAKRRADERRVFEAMIRDTFFPKCTYMLTAIEKCGADPEGTHWRDLPWVYHYHERERHTWNVETGETWEQREKREHEEELKKHPELADAEKKKLRDRFKPRGFRYPLGIPQIHRLLEERILKRIKEVKFVESIHVTAEFPDGRSLSIDLSDPLGQSMGYYEAIYSPGKGERLWDRKQEAKISFRVEAKEWKSDKANKVKVDVGDNDEEWIQKVKDWIVALPNYPELPKQTTMTSQDAHPVKEFKPSMGQYEVTEEINPEEGEGEEEDDDEDEGRES